MSIPEAIGLFSIVLAIDCLGVIVALLGIASAIRELSTSVAGKPGEK